MLAIAVVLVAVLALTTGGADQPAGAATAPTVVSANVVSSTSLGNSCTAATGWNLGTLTPGVAATTATGSGVCRFSFGSSNDTSMLRLSQRDRDGAAMTQRTNTTSMVNQSTLPGYRFRGVAGVPGASSTAWAVGSGSKVFRTTDSGTSWGPVTTGASGGLMAVAAPTTSNVFIGGDSSVFLRTVDGGTTWTPACPAPCGLPTSFTLANIAAADAAHVWVSINNVIYRSNDANVATPTWTAQVNPTGGTIYGLTALSATTAYATAGGGYIIETVDGGASWFTLTGITTQYWPSIAVVQTGGNDYVYACWAYGSITRVVRPTGSTAPASTFVDTPNVDPARTDTLSVTAVTKDDVEVVGRDGMAFRSTNASNATPSWTSVPMSDPVNFWASWRDASRAYVVGTGQFAAVSTDGGASFTRRNFTGLTDTNDWTSIAMASGSTGWVVGGTIGGVSQVRRTTDGGATWTVQPSGVAVGLHGVAAWDSTHAVAVGDGGTIIRTVDGSTWTTVVVPGVTEALESVTTATGLDGSSVAYASGTFGRMLRSTDGGATWTASTFGTSRWTDISSAPDNSVVVATGVGVYTLARSTDGGATWQTAPDPPGGTAISVAVADAAHAYLGSSNGYLFTTSNLDAATFPSTTWTLLTGSPGGGANDVAAFDATHVAFAAAAAVAGRSEDGSTLGTFPSPTILDFRGVAQTDASHMWVVGEAGRLYRAATPGTVTDYTGGSADWGSGAATSTFGVCLQAVGGSAVPVWPVDTGNTAGLCEPLAGDAWQAVPTAPTKVAHTLAVGQSGSLDLVWGMRAATSTPPGAYRATITIDVLAPDA